MEACLAERTPSSLLGVTGDLIQAFRDHSGIDGKNKFFKTILQAFASGDNPSGFRLGLFALAPGGCISFSCGETHAGSLLISFQRKRVCSRIYCYISTAENRNCNKHISKGEAIASLKFRLKVIAEGSGIDIVRYCRAAPLRKKAFRQVLVKVLSLFSF